ncbi:hypothetical protein AB0J74_05215 [Asanoa sp. NPDC049573]|uniref:hypothetical protein n=1 Tax=Asanoa sp. NPDC049573 TaxID=3155396 RepID=UPI003423BD04
MDARPLKDVFSDLVGDPSAGADALAAAGHDLPADLVAEAVVSFAGTAPAEVAEHLAPFVTANSGVPAETDGTGTEWFDLLATAPDPDAAEDLDAVFDAAPDAHAGIGEFEFGAGADADADLGTDAAGDDLDDAADDGADDADGDDFDDATDGFQVDDPALDLVDSTLDLDDGDDGLDGDDPGDPDDPDDPDDDLDDGDLDG